MAEIREVLVLHHSHTDIGYTHTQPVLWELERRFIDQAIELCEQTADWPEQSLPRWTCETTAPVLHWLKSATSGQIERFTRHASAGRISIGAMLCNITPLYSAEQLARSLYPIRELRRQFGLPISVAINHDVNGLPWTLSELLLDAGVDLLLMGINIHFGGYPLWRPLGFQWQSPDGRRLLAYNGEHYSGFERELRLKQGSTDAMAEGLQAYIERLHKQDYPYDFIYLTSTHPYFADNNPPNPALYRMVRKWNDEGRTPQIRFATPEMIGERLRNQPEGSVPTFAGDWTDYWNFGSASSAAETRINRESRARLLAAEVLVVTAQAEKPSEAVEAIKQLTGEAFWNLNMYDEHTWGAAASVAAPDRDGVVAQWYHKAGYAYRARDLIALIMRDRLEDLAANPADGHGASGVLLYNGAPVERSVYTRIPHSWIDGVWQHFTSKVHAIEMEKESWNSTNSSLAGPFDLPAFGYRTVPLADLQEARDTSGLEEGEGWVASPFYRLDYDAATGKILGLFDRRLERQLVDTASPWSFFGFVQETVDEAGQTPHAPDWGREALFDFEWRNLPGNTAGWNPDWPSLRRRPDTLKSVAVAKTPEGISLLLRWSALGVEQLEQQITLFRKRPAVGLFAEFYKEDIRTPEAIYFSFPCDLPGWRAYYDTAEMPVEFDTEQLPGACRDWVTAGNWVAIQNDRFGLTLALPDAPLIQFGDFNFGKMQRQVERSQKPLLLAWPVNNYWNTNFRISQPGRLRFRYELTTHAQFDPAQSTQFGLAAITPVELHPLVGSDSSPTAQQGQILQVTGDGIIPLHIKPAEHDLSQGMRDLIVRLLNVSGQQAEANVRLAGRYIQAAYLASTLEEVIRPIEVIAGEDDSSIRIEIPSRKIVVLRIQCV